MIKEDHFACTTRMFEILAEACRSRPRDLVARATQVHLRTRAHILAASDYSLVKEQLLKSYAVNPYKVHQRSTSFPHPGPAHAFRRHLVRPREAESYRSLRRCQSAPRKNFLHPSRKPAKTVRPATYVANSRSLVVVKGVAGATCDPGLASPQFKHHGRPEIEWQEQTQPTQRRDIIPRVHALSSPTSVSTWARLVSIALTLALRSGRAWVRCSEQKEPVGTPSSTPDQAPAPVRMRMQSGDRICISIRIRVGATACPGVSEQTPPPHHATTPPPPTPPTFETFSSLHRPS